MFMQDATRFSFDAASLIKTETAPATGLLAHTLVETSAGWRVATALRIGMGVYTLEGGLRPVLALDCRSAEVGTTVVRLPGGSFDNCSDLDLLPEQDVVLDRRGGALARVPARMMAGHRGARLIRLEQAMDIVTLLFAEDEVIWTNSGTRLYCAGIGAQSVGFVPRLDGSDADALLGYRARHHAA
jgi:hypothetical protein